MRYALVNGEKTEATKRAKGTCPNCGSELTAKCGEKKIHHWAHKGERHCDKWWENETEWHRNWKGEFPVDWQEVRHLDRNSGETHIADILTISGRAIEFQYSYLRPEERRSRDAFYPKLVWVVNGLRRQSDKKQFQIIIGGSKVVYTDFYENTPLRRAESTEGCKVLEEWRECEALVFFDFHEVDEYGKPFLWFLLPEKSKAETYLMRFPRSRFIESHRNGQFNELIARQVQAIREKLTGKRLNAEGPTSATAIWYQRRRAYLNRNHRL
jgi:hypothetical protein